MNVETKRLVRLGATSCVLAVIGIYVNEPISAVVCGVAGLVTLFLGMCILPGDFYPLITRQVFSDRKTFEEFRDSLRFAPDIERIIWYVYNLPPDDFLNFIRLVVELRDASNQEGLRRIANMLRQYERGKKHE